ncbi:MAG TPA: glycosyltransferase family 2 protein [Candidatus Moranbacteria bacterium]|nr:glycosyltransferase family 2 protein [Candidatus Moranbacteria bacterium]HRZ33599.1 glycosyltransferase family 2 protein [Candidatus Moranbacteria bacterium]
MSEKIYPKISVIVLNFNGKKTLDNCLSSVFHSDYSNFDVVVVDNNSEDGSLEQAMKLFSRAYFIKNDDNVGFSKGNNIGIRYALEKFADYVFILNNDTLVEKNTLSLLIDAMENYPLAGIGSPLVFTPDNTSIWFAGGNIHWKKMKASHLHKIESEAPYPTEYISGCAMLVKKDVFKKIGLFDERFFLYYEDADFSFRTKEAGFKLIIIPSAHIRHFEQSNAINKMKAYWLVLSGLIFFRTHSSFLNKLWIFFVYIPLRKLKNYYDVCFGKNNVARDVQKAYKDFKNAFKK